MESGEPLPAAAVRKEATSCLEGVVNGDPSARSRLFLMLLAELRSLARSLLRQERKGHTLQPTALVNEAWVRLIGSSKVEERSRVEFFGIAADAMRKVLVDYARKKNALKRGGDLDRIELIDGAHGEAGESLDVLRLNRALDKLRRHSEPLARLVDLRYFAGLDREATAQVMRISDATLGRNWRAAKAFLKLAMEEDDFGGSRGETI